VDKLHEVKAEVTTYQMLLSDSTATYPFLRAFKSVWGQSDGLEFEERLKKIRLDLLELHPLHSLLQELVEQGRSLHLSSGQVALLQV
jgi:hypothetical protein